MAAGEVPFTKTWKNYTFYTPLLSDPSIAYVYDLIGQESLMAGETTLVDWKKKLYLTAGGIVDVDGEGDSELKESARNTFDGIPFIGIHVKIPLWKVVNVGGFYARDWEEGKNLAGLKADFALRFW